MPVLVRDVLVYIFSNFTPTQRKLSLVSHEWYEIFFDQYDRKKYKNVRISEHEKKSYNIYIVENKPRKLHRFETEILSITKPIQTEFDLHSIENNAIYILNDQEYHFSDPITIIGKSFQLIGSGNNVKLDICNMDITNSTLDIKHLLFDGEHEDREYILKANQSQLNVHQCTFRGIGNFSSILIESLSIATIKGCCFMQEFNGINIDHSTVMVKINDCRFCQLLAQDVRIGCIEIMHYDESHQASHLEVEIINNVFDSNEPFPIACDTDKNLDCDAQINILNGPNGPLDEFVEDANQLKII